MRIASRAALVLLLLPTLLSAQSKKKTVPAAFSSARYAWVESMNGDIYSSRTMPEDRQAIADVQDALRAWNRYALTVNKSEAELVFVVRKGRLASAKVGGSIGVGTPSPAPAPGQRPAAGPGTGLDVGGEVGPPDDFLEVHMLNTDGSLGAIIWQRSFPNGLDAPQVTLVAQLRKAVDKDYPLNPPAAKP